jgi:thiol:disulfide interchange protein DsbD
LTACSRETATSTPPTEERSISSVAVVKVSPEEVTISPGGTAQGRIRLHIDSGFHVNANPPTYSYLKPTELELKPDGGVSVDSITYPKPLQKKFPFAGEPLAIYEGETVISVTFKAAKSASVGRKNLSGKLRVQACDDRVCYAPGEKEIAIALEVK